MSTASRPSRVTTHGTAATTCCSSRAANRSSIPTGPTSGSSTRRCPSSERGSSRSSAPVIEGCARAGFDAVEFDNLDTWTRFDAIDPEGAQALAQEYAVRAHEVGLAAAQKNAVEVAATARAELGFDFAVVEECAAWAECAAYAEAYGDSVLQIEYPDVLAEAGLTFADVCAAEDRAPLTILRDRALAPHDEPGALYRRC
ncbi:MAG TPA: endo alpha-1,4 polygalactosaminidase [Microbacterium sp.]|nr:endo alpha-1,4 polygalactosaminidase [Microbacterium sp.]